jgi:membrane-associated phospholipid phosphatase
VTEPGNLSPADRPDPQDDSLGDRLHRRARGFDDAVDRAFDRVRGHKVVDRGFYEASELGDFSLLWHLIGATQALRADDPLTYLARASGILGLESVIVNQGIKRLFDRERPVHDGDRPHHLRRPLTSSFPSGHASAAFTAAVVLSQGRRGRPLFFAAAAVVASSRVYVRIHHASDVVAGATLGYLLGRVAVRVWARR